MMILQGVGHPVPYLGVLYANDPKKGGYMAYAPALDLTTLFEVILKPTGLQTREHDKRHCKSKNKAHMQIGDLLAPENERSCL